MHDIDCGVFKLICTQAYDLNSWFLSVVYFWSAPYQGRIQPSNMDAWYHLFVSWGSPRRRLCSDLQRLCAPYVRIWNLIFVSTLISNLILVHNLIHTYIYQWEDLHKSSWINWALLMWIPKICSSQPNTLKAFGSNAWPVFGSNIGLTGETPTIMQCGWCSQLQ